MAREPLIDTDPRQVGRYRLSARLGSGGMGVVYLGAAEDGRQVAVKVLRPQLAENREFRTRFAREVAALTRVRGVCTVRVIEADTASSRPFLVTELVDGPSLAEYIEVHGPLSARMMYGLATGLAEALAAIHEAGIVHRDFKPSNVLLTRTGPKVIDFGIAQAMDATSLTRTGVTIGSTGFVAPEQILGGQSGPAVDIFAWGVTVAYAAGGQSPFGTGTSEIILYRVLHTVPDLISVPADLRPLVAAALSKEPGNRPGARQLLDQLTETSAQPDSATQTVLAQPHTSTQTILAQTWRAPEPGPASRSPAAAPAQASRPPAAPAAPAASPRAAAPAAAPRAPAAPPPAAQAPRPAESGPVAQAYPATAETVIPAELRSAESPRPAGTWPPPAWPPPAWQHQPGPGAPAAGRRSRRRVIVTVIAILLALAVAGAVIGLLLAGHHNKSSGGGAPAAALPVLSAGSYHGVKPAEIAFSGDGTNVVTRITWASWTATTATGSGTSDIDSCIPSCAQASPDDVTTMLVLSQPVDGRFTVISEVRGGTTQAFVYPNAWAQSAS